MTVSPTQRLALQFLSRGNFQRTARGWRTWDDTYFQPGTILALEGDGLVLVNTAGARITKRGRVWLRQTEDMEREMARVEAKRAAQ